MAGLLVPTPAAEAIGAAECLITGTIRFIPSAENPERGAWNIDPAMIQCQGMFNFVSSPRQGNGVGESFNPQGQQFRGTGSYQTVPSSDGGCLHELGEGEVDYWIPHREAGRPHEGAEHLPPGRRRYLHDPDAATGRSRSRGTGQLPDGPGDQGPFLAEVTLVRTSGAGRTPPARTLSARPELVQAVERRRVPDHLAERDQVGGNVQHAEARRSQSAAPRGRGSGAAARPRRRAEGVGAGIAEHQPLAEVLGEQAERRPHHRGQRHRRRSAAGGHGSTPPRRPATP